MCSIGREFKTVTDICTVCRASTYQDSSSSLPCKPCPNGRILVNEGREGEPDVPRHDDISDCTTCGKGTRFKKSASPCEVCLAGMYQNRSDVDGVQCTFCPTARYLAVNGTVDDHSSFDDCKMCPVGKEILSVDRECQVCQGGRYQDQVQESDSECKRCKVSHVIVVVVFCVVFVLCFHSLQFFLLGWNIFGRPPRQRRTRQTRRCWRLFQLRHQNIQQCWITLLQILSSWLQNDFKRYKR